MLWIHIARLYLELVNKPNLEPKALHLNYHNQQSK
jgi:hypothetical protein